MPANIASRTSRLRRFIVDMTSLIEKSNNDEVTILDKGQAMLADLVATDDWLPAHCSEPDPDRYSQYLLYCDPFERFSIVSFVWGAGQGTPIHDHTVWGLVGMLRGAEISQAFTLDENGIPRGGDIETLAPGMVERVSPTLGDIHPVKNAFADRSSISIHVYGANIGKVKRHVFDAQTGAAKDFVSGYSSESMPNIWGMEAA